MRLVTCSPPTCRSRRRRTRASRFLKPRTAFSKQKVMVTASVAQGSRTPGDAGGRGDGLPARVPRVDLGNVRGIEVNGYAAELARVSVWIGQTQWMLRNGFGTSKPILSPLDTIERRDAILSPDGCEAEWPEADLVIGNPPFIGGKLLVNGLGRTTSRRCSRPTAVAYPRKPIWSPTGTSRPRVSLADLEVGRVRDNEVEVLFSDPRGNEVVGVLQSLGVRHHEVGRFAITKSVVRPEWRLPLHSFGDTNWRANLGHSATGR